MFRADIKGGLLWSSISQFGISGIQFVATIVLARLLTPNDFGIIAPIAIFISVSNILIDSGMGGYLVIKKNVDEIDYSTLFLFNVVISLFLYLFLFITSPIIAEYFNSTTLVNIIRIQSMTIVFNGLSIIYYIHLLRNQRFQTLAIINFIAGIFSLIVAIILAYYNFGVWALVYQQLSFSVFYTLFLIINFKFFPRFIFSITAFKEQFFFGVHLLFANLLKTVSDNVYPAVVTKVVSLSQTGNFFQTNRIIGYFDGISTGIIDKALFPTFAKIEDKNQFIAEYSKLNFSLLSIVIPVTMLFSMFSEQVTLLLLGNQWKYASWMLSIMCFAFVPQIIQALGRTILKSIGVTKHILIIEAVKSCTIITLLLVSSILGLEAIVWSFIVSQIISSVLVMYIVSRNLKFNFLDQMVVVLSLLFLAFISYLFVKWIEHYFLQINSLLFYLLKTIGFFSIYLSLLFIFRKNLIRPA